MELGLCGRSGESGSLEVLSLAPLWALHAPLSIASVRVQSHATIHKTECDRIQLGEQSGCNWRGFQDTTSRALTLQLVGLTLYK